MPTKQRSNCEHCAGSGLLSWRQPDNFPAAECVFCTCELGRRKAQFYHARDAARQEEEARRLFGAIGIPPKFAKAEVGAYYQWLDRIAATGKDKEKERAIKAALALAKNGLIRLSSGEEYYSLKLDGPFGSGKTFLATAALKALYQSRAGASAIWIDYPHLMLAIQAGYADGTAAAKLRAVEEADLLLIDELGGVEFKGSESEDKIRLLEMVVNGRLNYQRPTIVTTNMDDATFIKRLGRRLFERFKEDFAAVNMAGRNLREEPLQLSVIYGDD